MKTHPWFIFKEPILWFGGLKNNLLFIILSQSTLLLKHLIIDQSYCPSLTYVTMKQVHIVGLEAGFALFKLRRAADSHSNIWDQSEQTGPLGEVL